MALRIPAKSRSYVSVALMAIGLVILLYVGAQYARMYFGQRRLAQQWEEQQHRAVPAGTASPTVNSTNPADEVLSTSDTVTVNHGLTRLTIPKIHLDDIVVEGTDSHDLMLGPGHLRRTVEPGETGNAVISGHRDTFFRHIYELKKGDLITVRRNGKTYHYEVTGKKVVQPEDLSVIRPSHESHLTLITCYPIYYIGPAPDRLVVFSKMVPDNSASALAQDASPTVNGSTSKKD